MSTVLPLPQVAGPLGTPAPLVGRARPDRLTSTALALMATTVTTSALGVVFWAGASRLYTPRQLGEDAALISAMMLLSIISQLNLGMGITRLLPQVLQRRWRPVLGAYVVSGAVAVVVTCAFVEIAPRLSDGFAFLAHRPALGVALVAGVVFWNVFALQDAVLTSARWARVLPIENGIFGILKIALMAWLGFTLVRHGLFLAWIVAMAVMVLPVSGLIFGRVLPRTASKAPVPTVLPVDHRRGVARYLAADYVAALLSQGYNALLPLLVIGVLGQAANAYFYIAFLIAAAVGELARSLSTSLVVEGAHEESELATLTRRSVVRWATLVAPVVVVLIVGAPVVLRPFGAAYVDHGTTLLRLLLAGTLPQAIVTLYLGVERVRARPGRVVAIEAAIVVLVSTGAIVGMRLFGLTGVGVAWLVAQAGVATAVFPRLRAVWKVPTR